ncbi:MAG TPA: RIP metalloprotease RseP [Steroidobacteraceae bacterium]|nr:RIP metalloprotease RseP [Steroidobacteraceae bacterium]
MTLLTSILAFIVAISVLVAVHEFGHYWVARRLGFKVLRFSIGFGRPLWKRVAGPDQVEYVIAAIPLGGYVKLLDEREGPVPTADLPRSFTHRPVWQRLLVLAAGPAFNFMFAILAYWALFMWGVPQARPVVGDILNGSYAAEAGLRPGDQILEVDGSRTPDAKSAVFALLENVLDDGAAQLNVRSSAGETRELELRIPSAAERHKLTEPGLLMQGLGFDFASGPTRVLIDDVSDDSPAALAGLRSGDVVRAIDGQEPQNAADFVARVQRRGGERVLLSIERDGQALVVPVSVRADREGERTVGRIGAALTNMPSALSMERLGPVSALGRAAGETWQMSALTVNMLWNMVMGRVSVKNISGPINIAAFAGETARVGLRPFLTFLAIVSISLGILNLLPIPILDGGQMLFQVIEAAKGSPLSERAQLLGQQVGIALLLLLMSLAFYNDISSRFLN